MRRNFPVGSAILILATFLCFIPLLANAFPQALPDAVTHAHTVFLENETGFNELQYTLILELSKWGRFDVVDAREKADLILRLDNGNHVRVVPEGQAPSAVNAAPESEVPRGHTRISLLDPKSNSVLWSDTHKTDGGKVKNGHLLDGLREAFDSYGKSRH
jgi:hypothetical protein